MSQSAEVAVSPAGRILKPLASGWTALESQSAEVAVSPAGRTTSAAVEPAAYCLNPLKSRCPLQEYLVTFITLFALTVSIR